MTTRPIHRTVPAVEALEDRCLLSCNGIFPLAAPVCPGPAEVTHQSGGSSGVADQGPLAPTVSLNAVQPVPGHYKTVYLRPRHHGQHFQTALGAVLRAGGTGSLLPEDTPGGGQGQDKPVTLQDSPQDRVKKVEETANGWADTALKLQELWVKLDEAAEKKQKEADDTPKGPKKDRLQRQADFLSAQREVVGAALAQATQNAKNATEKGGGK
jgi:hypothetical protein